MITVHEASINNYYYEDKDLMWDIGKKCPNVRLPHVLYRTGLIVGPQKPVENPLKSYSTKAENDTNMDF